MDASTDAMECVGSASRNIFPDNFNDRILSAIWFKWSFSEPKHIISISNLPLMVTSPVGFRRCFYFCVNCFLI